MSYIKTLIISAFLLLVLAISGYSQAESLISTDSIPSVAFSASDSTYNLTNPHIDSIIALGKTLLNKPYRYKGPAPWQMDCSGYLKYIYGVYGYELPHSSAAIGEVVMEIELKDVRKGDFLFFKGRSISSPYIGHVVMVIDVFNDGSMLMMHSTVKRGIIIEKYPSAYYYTPRFVKAGRLPAFCTKSD